MNAGRSPIWGARGRGFAGAGSLLAAVAVLVVLAPIAVQLANLGGPPGSQVNDGAVDRADAIRRAVIPSVGLVLSSVAYAGGIGVLATLLALPAAWHARGRGALAFMLVPLACPTYLAYAGLNLLRAPGTVVGDWLERSAAHAEWIPLLAGRALAVAGLALWAWPLAMLALLPALRRVDDALLETMRMDGLSRSRRARAVLAISRDGVLLAVASVSLLMLGSAVPLHLAQAPTYAVEVWATLAQRPGSTLAWVQGWPLVGVAIAGAVAISRRVTRALETGWEYDEGPERAMADARRPVLAEEGVAHALRHARGGVRHGKGFRSSASAYRPHAGTFRAGVERGAAPGPSDAGGGVEGAGPRATSAGPAAGLALLVWGASVLIPLALFAMHLRSWASIPAFLAQERWAILESLRTGVLVAGAMFVLALLAWASVSGRRGARLPLAVWGAMVLFGVGALLPGVLMGSAVLRAGQGLGTLLPGAGTGDLLDASLPVVAHVGRFGMLAVLAGTWLAGTQSLGQQDLARMEGAGGVRRMVEFALRPHLGWFVGVAAAGLLLSLQEIESTTIVQPPGPGCLAHTILGYLHFAREEQMCAAGVVLLGGGTLLAAAGAWWAQRQLAR